MTGKEWIARLGLVSAAIVFVIAAFAATLISMRWFAPIPLPWKGTSVIQFLGAVSILVGLANGLIWWRVFRRIKHAKA